MTKTGRIGLRALGVNLEPIKDLKVSEIFGTGVLPVTECSKKWWELIKAKNLKVKLEVASKNQAVAKQEIKSGN